MEEVYAGADILFHEAYSFDPKTNPYDAKAPVSVPYVNAFHTSTEQLAGVLKMVNPKVHARERDRPRASGQGVTCRR